MTQGQQQNEGPEEELISIGTPIPDSLHRKIWRIKISRGKKCRMSDLIIEALALWLAQQPKDGDS